MVTTHQRTHQRTHVVLFSTDLSLSATQTSDYDSLRLQIEFNFRAAKPCWGLEDCMPVSDQVVTNAVNLAFLMVNLSAAFAPVSAPAPPDCSVLDLKADWRAPRYRAETIQLLPDPPDDHLISRLWLRLAS